MNDDWPEGMMISQITIRRTLTDAQDGDIISVHSEDSEGSSLTLLEILGLLEFAKDSFTRLNMAQEEDP